VGHVREPDAARPYTPDRRDDRLRKPVQYLRRWVVLPAFVVTLAGLAIIVVGDFSHAEALGGLLAGGGTATLVAELTVLRDRAAADAAQRRLENELVRVQMGAVFPKYRVAGELAAVVTQCAFGEEAPPPQALARFRELCDALDLGDRFAHAIPPAGPGREKQAPELYEKIRQVLIDRHSVDVAAVFAFIFMTGVVTGGTGNLHPEIYIGLSERLIETIQPFRPEPWVEIYLSVNLSRWHRRQVSTEALKDQLDDLSFYLMNYGSTDPRVLACEARMRTVAQDSERD
jgi:hypothetical protein